LINFSVFALIVIWNFIMVKYLEYTGKNCTLDDKNEKYRKTYIVITWILFSLACIGAVMALLEVVGVLHGEYKLI